MNAEFQGCYQAQIVGMGILCMTKFVFIRPHEHWVLVFAHLGTWHGYGLQELEIVGKVWYDMH